MRKQQDERDNLYTYCTYVCMRATEMLLMAGVWVHAYTLYAEYNKATKAEWVAL